MTRRRRLHPVLALVLLAAAASAETPGEAPDPDAAGLTASRRRAALVARSAWEHARLQTLEAAFVQLKESPMLLAPERSEGSFCYRAPDAMRWDYVPAEGVDPGDAPPPVTVIVRDRQMVTWYRDQGRAERTDLGRRADRMLKLLGPGSSLADLERTFTLAIELPAAGGEPYRVRLEPRSTRVARRLSSIDMELDRELFLPVFLRLTGAGGDVTELRFDRLRINGGLPADRFEAPLPIPPS